MQELDLADGGQKVTRSKKVKCFKELVWIDDALTWKEQDIDEAVRKKLMFCRTG